ncbi:MAG: 3-oxoacyl-ACP synthase, partial [Eubacterium sp.]
MMGIELIATGRGIPGRLVTNDDLAQFVDTNDAWIRERTGILSRYFCAEDEGGVDLATRAAQSALSRSGVSPESIGACIVATVSPDNMTPSTANM